MIESSEPLAAAVVPGDQRAPTADEARRIGVIDLGSNTARLVVFECNGTSSYRMVDSVRERVRLAEGLNQDGTLKPAAISRALAAMELFHDFVMAVGLDGLEVIATSAVRDAANREEILGPLRELGLEPRVLDGHLEAAYGVLAVANTSCVDNAWVIDQGGGSLQLSLMEHRTYQHGEAFQLGTLRLTEAFLASEHTRPVTPAQVREVENHLEKTLGPALEALRQKPYPLVCMGGTVRNLASAAQHQQQYPLNLLHGYRLRQQPLEQLTRLVLQRTVNERQALPGLSTDRADVIGAGAITFRWLLRKSQRKELVISGAGVREGALLRRLLPAPHLIEDVRRFSIGNVASHYPQPVVHTENVVRLALQLFDQLQPLHGLAAADRLLLEAAAGLHDIGMAVSYYRHHRHGAFLLEAAGLDGFEHHEIAMLSLLVRYHRKSIPSRGAFATLLAGEEDERRLWSLAACLRLAEHLERSRTGRIGDLEFKIADDVATLHLKSKVPPTVEIWEARKDAELFELAFERKLEIQHRPS